MFGDPFSLFGHLHEPFGKKAVVLPMRPGNFNHINLPSRASL